ncbi:hypothetical protein [Stigmatella erecta]|uniref:hypothetical protein n=1 Tax=Stigmatella erecta TaxID=83460 RepID=UPI0015A5CDEA|nr:hypothetical protein [Stigmatella erecta]
MCLNISEDKKNPLAWRLRYGELDGIPVECWPVEAVEYPKRDARHTIDVFFKQEEEARGVTNGGNLHAEPDQTGRTLAGRRGGSAGTTCATPPAATFR